MAPKGPAQPRLFVERRRNSAAIHAALRRLD
jgi:hypothetical protein